MGRIDIKDRRFGRLVAIERAPDHIQASGYRETMWKCKCDCGNIVIIRTKCLLQDVTKSCGCLQRELLSQRAGSHHKCTTRLYQVWDTMRQRCNNPNCNAYKNYGARGIKIVPEWDDYSVFYDWAMKNGYDENAPKFKYTLDRIDVDADYGPENCRWVSMKIQSNNKRNTIKLTYQGETHSLSEWADIIHVNYCTLWGRYKHGWSVERILTTPIR